MKRLVLAWAVTAVAATGASLAVLGLLGTGVTGTSSRVLSQEDARAALATAGPRAVTTPAGTPAQGQQGKLIRSAGGTVIASCSGEQVVLRSWSPAQGYSVDGVEPGPAPEATVEFEPDEGEDVELKIVCAGGSPVTR
ncbi:hypothetical protein ETD86_41640 [Nonomuraea turkmeniaca]|uniref:Septum formation initiator n=1 Tax=Nonomuraea turkmeniaca TaxID=103838 RepID=A0A5S4FLA5_9ACTN|nr:hypothetical protein [Nonomuraea turkmeniaca]TMR09909.1 hypothetical protein ETD86_41640 [Nonomuraea turkmeniaca]